LPAYRRFLELRSAALKDGLASQFVQRLGSAGLREVLNRATGIKELSACMAALIGQPIPASLVGEFLNLSPTLDAGDFSDAVTTLRVARAFDRTVAIRWVEQAGQDAMFSRFSENVLWAERPTLNPCDEGLEVRANLWSVVPAVSSDLNSSVVHVCEVLSAVAPSADIFSSDALGADGLVITNGEYAMVSKRMQADILIPTEGIRRNRAWMAALNAQLADDSYTDYLHRSLEELRILVAHLGPFLDGLLRKKYDTTAHGALVRVYEASKLLVAPSQGQPHEPNGRWSKLAYILSSCAADVPTRLHNLPDGANAYIGWIDDLMKDVSSAEVEEPWSVLGIRPPEELRQLTEVLQGVRALAGEASIRKQSPLTTHFINGIRKGLLFTKACKAAEAFRVSRLEKLKRSLDDAICTAENGIKVFLIEEASVPVFWPPADVLLSVPVESPNAFSQLIAESWPAWRAFVDESRRICILPVMGGYGMTKLASSGLGTLYPDTDPAAKWCVLAGVEPLPTPTVDAFSQVSSFLIEAEGIEAYRAAKGELNHDEEAHYRGVVTKLEGARAAFAKLEIPEQLKKLVNELVESNLQGKLPLAPSVNAMLRGEAMRGAELLGGLVHILTMLDGVITTRPPGVPVTDADLGIQPEGGAASV
jgi:hypothetical protein